MNSQIILLDRFSIFKFSNQKIFKLNRFLYLVIIAVVRAAGNEFGNKSG